MQAMPLEGFPFSQFNLTRLTVYRLALTRGGVFRLGCVWPFYFSPGIVYLGCYLVVYCPVVPRLAERRLAVSRHALYLYACVSPPLVALSCISWLILSWQ